jgi:hypothetical protein
MSRLLTAEELVNLDRYCLKKGVQYYDVRIELVDHLANYIEAQWVKNKDIDFDFLFQQAHSQFGRTGFRKLMYEREKITEKNIRKQFWLQLKAHFRWPLLLKTLTLIIAFISLQQWLLDSNPIMLQYILGMVAVIVFIAEISHFVIVNRKTDSMRYKLLITQCVTALDYCSITLFPIIQFIYDFLFTQKVILQSGIMYWIIASVLIFNILVIFTSKLLAQKIFAQAKSQYPECFSKKIITT